MSRSTKITIIILAALLVAITLAIGGALLGVLVDSWLGWQGDEAGAPMMLGFVGGILLTALVSVKLARRISI